MPKSWAGNFWSTYTVVGDMCDGDMKIIPKSNSSQFQISKPFSKGILQQNLDILMLKLWYSKQ